MWHGFLSGFLSVSLFNNWRGLYCTPNTSSFIEEKINEDLFFKEGVQMLCTSKLQWNNKIKVNSNILDFFSLLKQYNKHLQLLYFQSHFWMPRFFAPVFYSSFCICRRWSNPAYSAHVNFWTGLSCVANCFDVCPRTNK